MANGSTIGKLVVDLFLDDQDFDEGLDEAERRVKRTGGAMDWFADLLNSAVVGAFKAATVAATAFVAASALVGSSFEQEIARISAITGATGDDLEALTNKARELGKATLFTATEAASAIRTLGQAGLSVAEATTAADAALVLAGTTGAGIEESAALLVSTMKQFGLEADQTGRIADVFSMAMRNSLLDMTSLTEAMKFAGTAGAGFGMTLEETVASVAAFRDLGLEGSLAGTNFRMSLIQAANASDTARAALEKYGLTIEDINPETRTFAEIIETIGEVGISTSDAIRVFGSRSGANIAQLAAQAREGKVDFEAFTAALMASGGAAEEAYGRMLDTVRSQGAIVVSALQDLLIETFETYAEPLADVLRAVSEALNVVSDTIANQSGAIRASVEDALGDLAAFIDENAEAMGQAFVDAAEGAASLAKQVIRLLPYLDDLAKILLTIWGIQKVLAFTSAVNGAVTALRAMAASGTAASAGLGPVGVALAAIAASALAIDAAMGKWEKSIEKAEKRVTATGEKRLAMIQQELDALEKQATVIEAQALLQGGLTDDQLQRAAELNGQIAKLQQEMHAQKVTMEAMSGAAGETGDEAGDAASGVEDLAGALKSLADAGAEGAAGTQEQEQAALELRAAFDALGTGSGLEQVEDDLFEVLALMRDLDLARAEAGEAPLDLIPAETISRLQEAEIAVSNLIGEPALSRADAMRQEIARLAFEEYQAITDGSYEAAEGFRVLRSEVEAALRAENADRFADALRNIGAQAASAARSVAGIVADIFSGLTGGQVTVRGLLETATSGDEGGTQEAATSLIQGAVSFVKALADNLPGLITVVVNELPRLISAVVAAIPDIIQTLAAAIPDLFAMVVEQVPRLLMAIIKNVPDLIVAIVRELPTLIKGLVRALPGLIIALTNELPVLIEEIIKAVPEIVVALLKALPAIVEALVRAVPIIVFAIVQSLVTDLIPQLPKIVAELVAALVGTIGSVVTGFMAGVGKALPDVVRAFTQGLGDWLTDALQSIRSFFRDLIREITSVGTAETATFGDTPGPVLAGSGGLAARFAPGDYVVASQSVPGLLRQILGAVGAAPTAPVVGGASVVVRVGDETITRSVERGAASGASPAVANAIRAGQDVQVGFSRTAGRRR